MRPRSHSDIVYEEPDQIATIAINRPDVMNAVRGQTVEGCMAAMLKAGWDRNIGGGGGGRRRETAFAMNADRLQYDRGSPMTCSAM